MCTDLSKLGYLVPLVGFSGLLQSHGPPLTRRLGVQPHGQPASEPGAESCGGGVLGFLCPVGGILVGSLFKGKPGASKNNMVVCATHSNGWKGKDSDPVE